jgi:hypothetical protein
MQTEADGADVLQIYSITEVFPSLIYLLRIIALDLGRFACKE